MYIIMKLIPYKDSTYLENYQIQAVSTQNSTNIKKMILIKFILCFVICSMSAAMKFQKIQESKSISDKKKVLSYLRLGRLNRSRSGLLFH